MNIKPSLLLPAHDRKCRTFTMLCGSLLFHGTLVATAALWIHPASPPPDAPIDIDIGFVPEPPGNKAALPVEPPEPSLLEVVAPAAESFEAADDAPPEIDQDVLEPQTPRPVIPPRTTAVQKRINRASASVRLIGVQAVTAIRPGGSGTGLSNGGAASSSGWRISKPIYPVALRSQHVQGVSKVRVTTDASGRVSAVEMLVSSGSGLLDDNTIRRVRLDWSGPPNASTIREIEYKLQ